MRWWEDSQQRNETKNDLILSKFYQVNKLPGDDMKKGLAVVLLLLCAKGVWAAPQGASFEVHDGDKQVKIQVNPDAVDYNEVRMLRNRVEKLEQAVAHLQQSCSNNKERDRGERVKSDNASDDWSCRVKAFSEIYIGTGRTKAIAEKRLIDECKSHGVASMFCDDYSCEKED